MKNCMCLFKRSFTFSHLYAQNMVLNNQIIQGHPHCEWETLIDIGGVAFTWNILYFIYNLLSMQDILMEYIIIIFFKCLKLNIHFSDYFID